MPLDRSSWSTISSLTYFNVVDVDVNKDEGGKDDTMSCVSSWLYSSLYFVYMYVPHTCW